MLVDDARPSVSLPEVPLLAVLPGTGGLTRVTDKRKVRRDLADVFCSVEEGCKGKRAVEWRLVDEVVPNSRFDEVGRGARPRVRRSVRQARRGAHRASSSAPLERTVSDDAVSYSLVRVELDRAGRRATITLCGPDGGAAAGYGRLRRRRATGLYLLSSAASSRTRSCTCRLNETEIGLWTFRTEGDPERFAGARGRARGRCGPLARQRGAAVLEAHAQSGSTSPRARSPRSSSTAPASRAPWPRLLFAADRSYMMDGRVRGR